MEKEGEKKKKKKSRQRQLEQVREPATSSWSCRETTQPQVQNPKDKDPNLAFERLKQHH
jgi:hypothetical protein